MIKNRNVANDAAIALSKIQGLGVRGPLTGDPRYVIKTAATEVSTWIKKSVKAEFIHKTIDDAIGACKANRGDRVYVLPGHTETVSAASGITADVAGVEIIGVGNGADTPTLTFSATDSTIVISAASVSFKNFILVPSIDNVVSPIVVSGANCTVDVEVRDASDAVECTRAVLTTATADNLNVKVKHVGFITGAGCVNSIRLVGANHAKVDVDFYGVASTSIVEFHTTACTNVEVSGIFYNSGTTDLSKNVVASVASTWSVSGFDAAAGAEFSGGSGNAIAVGDLSVIAAGIVTIDGLHDVPIKDAATDTYMRDVIGRKTDSAAAAAVSDAESLMAYAKQNVTLAIARDTAIGVIDDFHDVGTANAVTNVVMSDVIGNKADAAADGAVSETESLVAYAKQTVNTTTRDNGRGGTIWYLDSGAAAAGTGTSWTDAWDTLAEAVAGAGSYDTILVKDGSTYDIGATQNIGVTGLHIIGTGAKDQNFAKAMIYGGTGHFLTINAHEVWIDNISFVTPLDTYDAIRVATTASYFKVKITNCKFDLSTGEYCIYAAGTYDAPDLVIENNLFRSFSTGGIYLNTTRAQVRNNRFLILNAGTSAIEHVPDGGNRPETVIVDNEIYGVNSTDIGIEITNTPTEALFHMSGNRVINCATPVTLSKYTSWYDGNYWGVDDANYHQGWGKADCEARGANGRIFYVDLNMATTGLDGLSWASAFDTVAAGLLAADTWIGTSGNRAWAKRCTVFACHDGEAETLTAASEKTDLVGIGYDIGGRPVLTGNFTIGTAVSGFRIFNYGFIPTTTAPVITFPSGMHKWELHDVRIYKVEGVLNTSGISATTTRDWVMKDVQVLPDAGGARSTIGVTLIGDSGNGMMENCVIEGIEALDIANPSKGTILKNSTLIATALALDDDSDDVTCINMRFITDAASGDVNGSTIVDWNAAKACGCEHTASDSHGPIPNVTVLA